MCGQYIPRVRTRPRPRALGHSAATVLGTQIAVRVAGAISMQPHLGEVLVDVGGEWARDGATDEVRVEDWAGGTRSGSDPAGNTMDRQTARLWALTGCMAPGIHPG